MQRIALNDLSRHSLAHREPLLRAINRVVDRGWFVHGPELEAFEREFVQYCGAGHAVGVANGTDAIELALRAIGSNPVFADVDDTPLVLNADTVDDLVRDYDQFLGLLQDAPRA